MVHDVQKLYRNVKIVQKWYTMGENGTRYIAYMPIKIFCKNFAKGI
jgi:hypothetical protein